MSYRAPTPAELDALVYGDDPDRKRPDPTRPGRCAHRHADGRPCGNGIGGHPMSENPPERCQHVQGRCFAHADHTGDEGCRLHPTWPTLVNTWRVERGMDPMPYHAPARCTAVAASTGQQCQQRIPAGYGDGCVRDQQRCGLHVEHRRDVGCERRRP